MHSIPPIPTRPRFPEHEARLPWLARLLDALGIVDAGVEASLAAAQNAGRLVACGPGCGHCCRRQLIPVTSLEIAGLSWYCLHQLKDEARRRVKRALVKKTQAGCRFLLDGRCAVYPLRPIACRRFIVFDIPCGPDEDVWSTRQRDVLIPLPEHKPAADRLMLPYYGITDASALEAALDRDYLRSVSQLLFACTWKPLYEAMAQADAAR